MPVPEQSAALSPTEGRAIDDLWNARLHNAAGQLAIVERLAAAPAVLHPVVKVFYEGDGSARKLAAQILSKLGEPAVSLVSDAVNSKVREVRELGITVLSEIGGSQAAEILRELILKQFSEARSRRRRRKIAKWVTIVVFVGAMVTWLALTPKHDHPPFFPIQITFQILLTCVFAEVVVSLDKRAIGVVSGVDNVRMVGALAVCLSIPDTDDRKIVTESLKKLLPRLKRSDSDFLDEQGREELLQALGRDENALRVAILKAYEQVGGEQEIYAVERLARYEPVPLVQDAAQGCLPAIRQRVEESRLAHTLLRPAESPDDQAEVLLRPAANAGGDSERLLRTIE